jgi:acyl-CoA synthetase (AMP-forming)/AMP-acid ligase II
MNSLLEPTIAKTGAAEDAFAARSGERFNVARALTAQAERQPDALAVAVADRQGGYVERNYAQLEADASRCAHVLRGLGIDRGVRTVLMVPPSPEFFALTFALFKVGAIPVFVDPGMGIANLKTCLAEAEPTAFIGIRKAHVARLVLGWCKQTLKIALTVGAGPRFWTGPRLEPLLEQAPSTSVGADLFRADEVAAILFTSGSTGIPKGAVYTHGMFEAQVSMIRAAFAIESGERDLATFPLFALFGPALGMASVVPEMDTSRPGRADPRKLIEAVQRYRCTNAFASPALVEKIGRYVASLHGSARQEARASLTTLKRVISAGAPASPVALTRLSEALSKDAQIHTPYGATEAMPLTAIESREILDETAIATKEGHGVCVGRALPGVELKIIAIDDRPMPAIRSSDGLPRGQIGEIVVCAPVVSPSYDHRADQTELAKTFDERGRLWHRMGDVGYLDERERLWMCGRKSHRVQCNGVILHSVPVEAIFDAHPSVRRTALVCVKINGAIEPLICVELETGNKWTPEIEEQLRQLGRAHDHTRMIDRFLVHSSFPVDVRHNAKIFREKLARWAQERV